MPRSAQSTRRSGQIVSKPPRDVHPSKGDYAIVAEHRHTTARICHQATTFTQGISKRSDDNIYSAARAVPVYTGVFRSSSSTICACRRCPRIYGGIPTLDGRKKLTMAPSPCVRGYSQYQQRCRTKGEVVPVQTGVFPDALPSDTGPPRCPLYLRGYTHPTQDFEHRR